MKMTRWGIIGPGNIARNFVQDLKLLDGPQIVAAILGNTPDSTKQFAEDFQISNYYTDAEEFFQHEMDVVYIASPHTLHYEHSLQCLQHHLPVLVEKPMAINLEQCEELTGLSKKNRAFLMEGMWIRFLPGIQQVLQMIKDGVIGNIVSIKASMGYKAPPDSNSRYFDPALGGGSLLDLGIYPVFLSLLLLGKPRTIKAIGTLSDQGIDEVCSVLFHYRDGQHAILESTLVSGSDLPAEIAGEKGVIKILDPWYEKSAGIELNIYGEGKVVYPCSWEGHGLQYEAAEVLNCLNTKEYESKLMSHAFSRMVIEVMDEIRSQINVVYDMYE